MDEKRMYTALEIADYALQKFGFSFGNGESNSELKQSVKANVSRRIRDCIKINKIESIGEKRSTKKAKRSAKAYSAESRDKIIYEYLMDYFKKNYANYSKIRNLEIAKEKSDFINEDIYEQSLKFLNENVSPVPEREIFDDSPIDMFSKEYKDKKMEIMVEAIFSSWYKLNSEKLLEDLNQQKEYKTKEKNSKQEFFIDWELENWENYIIKK